MGEGAFGKVYACICTPYKITVAIKEIDIIKVENFNEQNQVTRELEFLQEARSRHLNYICKFFGYFQNGNKLNLISEICPNGDLAGMIREVTMTSAIARNVIC